MSEQEFWQDCPLIHIDPEIVHGELVFVGTRLPASAILNNMDGYFENGVPMDQAIQQTLENFPTVPNDAEGIRALLAYRDSHESQLTASK